MRMFILKAWVGALGALALLVPHSAQACATCFGASDAPMAQGMNMGILSLLIVVGFVLSLFGAFFVFLVRRSGRAPMPGRAPHDSSAHHS